MSDYAVQLSTPSNAKNKKYPLNAFNEIASTWDHWLVNVPKELNDEYPRATTVV